MRNRSVRNSFCSSARRSSASACRNLANSPCGSRTTWKNCSADMPMASAISSSASRARVETVCQRPPRSSASRILAGSLVRPVPCTLGRSCCGRRVMRKCRSPIVVSNITSVRTVAPAWSERSRLVLFRSPGTRPYSANPIASSRVVLPAPVSPCSRKSPEPARSSKETSAVPPNAPNAVTRSRCGRISLPPPAARPPSGAAPSRAAPSGAGRGPGVSPYRRPGGRTRTPRPAVRARPA